MKTSINIKPCNIGQSEAHNRRDKAYIANINKNDLYLREDLTRHNEGWVSPEMEGMSLLSYQEKLGDLVKRKTGRRMQMKERQVKDRKTGKMKKKTGSSPIREGVVVCSPTTTMDDLKRFARLCQERWGIRALQIFLHKDEGHYEYDLDANVKVWKPNLHAHIIFDWMDHSTGKSFKLKAKDLSEMQTLLADTLGMERGESKAVTGRRHLEREEYIVATQKKEAREAERRKAEAEAARDAAVKETEKAKDEKRQLSDENAQKIEEGKKLDEENSKKKKEANDNIRSGIANLFGAGKFARSEKENKALKEENESLRNALPAKEKELRKRYDADVKSKAEEMARPLRVQLNKKSDDYNNLSDRSKRERQWRDGLLYSIGRETYKEDNRFRRAIDAIASLAIDSEKTRFTDTEAADIEYVINKYTPAPNKSNDDDVCWWLAILAQDKEKLNGQQTQKAYCEVLGIPQGFYNRPGEEEQYNIHRGR